MRSYSSNEEGITLTTKSRVLELSVKSRPLMVFLITIVLFVFFSFISVHFASVTNMEAIGYGILSVGIVAIGMMVVMISGGFDLSVGSTLAFTGVIACKLLEGHLPIWTAIVIALLLGAIIGYANGALITVVGINPFICNARHDEHGQGTGSRHHPGHAGVRLAAALRIPGRGADIRLPVCNPPHAVSDPAR